MKIGRRGYAADHGLTEKDLGAASSRWDERESALVIAGENGARFGASTHTYRFTLTQGDLRKALLVLADAAENHQDVAAMAQDNLAPLIRLINAGASARAID